MSKRFTLITVALILGLGWAIRGHFGHEWGASWAGGMAALAVLLTVGRTDWLRRTPVLAALGAVGWAVGGMMSYGLVIGYCRGNDFFNVAYGYAMLGVIGGLYGFIGGGLFGLGLETTESKKPDWARLISEMFVGGFLVWGLFIFQLEWFMTPPRSELWAGCLGAAVALAWYLQREGFHRSLRLAGYAALGAAVGFSFGNFIHTMGAFSDIIYNWWNVMEFTLGLLGGLGMAYAVLTSDWPETVKPSKKANWLAMIFLVLLIPFTNWIFAFEPDRFVKLAETIGLTNPEIYARSQIIFGGVILLLFATGLMFFWKKYQDDDSGLKKVLIPIMTFGYAIFYLVYGYIVKGMFYQTYSFKSSSTMYVPILLAAIALWFVERKQTNKPELQKTSPETWKRWSLILFGIILMIIVITLISITLHTGEIGFHERF